MIGSAHVRQWQAGSSERRNSQSVERKVEHASTVDMIIILGPGTQADL